MSLRQRLRGEAGITLVETLVTCAILVVVVGALVDLFVSASHAELNMSNRFQAQQEGRLALDSLRREIHCASAVSPTTGFPVGSVTITLNSACATSGGATSVTWCTIAVVPNQQYALWRTPGSTCTTTGGVKKADHLYSPSWPSGQAPVFSGFAPPGSCLRGRLSVDLPVRVNGGGGSTGAYDLKDDIVMRNTPRTGC